MNKQELKALEVYHTWYNAEDGTMDLGFNPSGNVVLRGVRAPGAMLNEFYWDNPKHVEQAINNASDDDVEVFS